MATSTALLDSSIIVALFVEDHLHHAASAALFAGRNGQAFAVAAHSHAEAFTTLTRRNNSSAFRWSGAEAWETLESIAAMTTLLSLSPAQVLDTIRNYAEGGGVGPRLYDRLIGQVAVEYGIPRIITWNVGHMRDLFPQLDVVAPSDIT